MAVAGSGAPDPEQASGSAEFVAALQALKDWSGLTYRELTSRAEAVGDVLPRSTMANMLSRSTVPREELVAAYVRACGCGPADVDTWLHVRKELSRGERQAGEASQPDALPRDPEEAVVPEGADAPEPPLDPSGPPVPRRRSRAALTAAAVVVTGAAALALTLAFRDLGSEEEKPAGEKKEVAAFTPLSSPSPGPIRIKAVHSGLCLAERGGQNGQLYQLPCSPDSIPSFSLKRVDTGWRLVTFHPEFGEGCTGVMEKSTEVGAPVEDQECGKRGPAEAFRLEPVGKPVRGFRLRPLHTELCAGVPGGATRKGAEIRQLTCTEETKGQLFALERGKSGPEPAS
ncbi:helix-turn-helix domain-containing protein [Streptomyces sp. NPDC002187]|uniref:RICIN domain-containing protein n=1 Tax=Streptomyces sp. NPDC002187 TaxID=3364637 RepID=UPI0036D038F7